MWLVFIYWDWVITEMIYSITTASFNLYILDQIQKYIYYFYSTIVLQYYSSVGRELGRYLSLSLLKIREFGFQTIPRIAFSGVKSDLYSSLECNKCPLKISPKQVQQFKREGITNRIYSLYIYNLSIYKQLSDFMSREKEIRNCTLQRNLEDFYTKYIQMILISK